MTTREATVFFTGVDFASFTPDPNPNAFYDFVAPVVVTALPGTPNPVPAPAPQPGAVSPVPVPVVTTIPPNPFLAIDQGTAFGVGTTPLDVLDPLGLFHDPGTLAGGSLTHVRQPDIEAVGAGGGTALAVRSAIELVRRIPGMSRLWADDIIRVGQARGQGTYSIRAVFDGLSPATRNGLIAAGIAGSAVLIDTQIDIIPGLDFGGGSGGSQMAGLPLGITLTPGWVANGVQFYYVSDGRLAVRNSKGRWKIWRPKKPIVLFANGAKDLRTMIRADTALNKQAKKLAAVLNRRAPRRSRPKETVTHHGDGVQVISAK